jgi:hypothetical protein
MITKTKEHEKEIELQASKLAEFIEKLHLLVINEKPKIEIKERYSLVYYIIFGPTAGVIYDPWQKTFKIYKTDFFKNLEKEEDKEAAVFGMAVHEVTHVYIEEPAFLPKDIYIFHGIVKEAIKKVNSEFRYKPRMKLDYVDKAEYDALVREHIAIILYQKLRNELEEDTILKIVAEKVIKATREDLLKIDTIEEFKNLLR